MHRIFLFVICFTLISILSTTSAFSEGKGNVFEHPVTNHQVVKNFIQPKDDYSAGHRGVDFKANLGESVFAIAKGRIVFSGSVAGRLHVSINHGSKIVSTYTFLSSRNVYVGDVVDAGELIGRVGVPGDGDDLGIFHLSMRVDGKYVDPLKYLNGQVPIRKISLAPLPDQETQDRGVSKERKYISQLVNVSIPEQSLLMKIVYTAIDGAEKAASTISKLKDKVLEYENNVDRWTRKEINHARKVIVKLEKQVIADTKAAIKSLSKLSKMYYENYKIALKAGVEVAKLYLERTKDTARIIFVLNQSVQLGIIDSMDSVSVTSQAILDQYFDVDWEKLMQTIILPGSCLVNSCAAAIKLACDPMAKFTVDKKFVGTKNSAMLVSGLQSSGRSEPLSSDDGSGKRIGQPTNIPWKKLGYSKSEITYYSYAGLNESFAATDTYQDLNISAQKMDEQIKDWKKYNANKKLDLFTHSLGGAVVGLWLANYYDPTDTDYPEIGKVVMFAPPLSGTQLADGGKTIDSTVNGKEIHDLLNESLGNETIPPVDSIALDQVVEDGELERALKESKVTEMIDIYTIRSASDPVVTVASGALPGEHETIINTSTFNPATTHTELTTDRAAISVAQRVLIGKKVPCVPVGESAKSIVSSAVVHASEVSISHGTKGFTEVYGDEVIHFLSSMTN